MKKKTGSTGPASQEILSIGEITDHLLESAAAILETDPEQAEEIVNRSLALSRNADLASGTGKGLLLLSQLLQRKGDFKGADSSLKEAEDHFAGAGLHAEASAARKSLGSLYAGAGQIFQAISELDIALDHARKAGDPVAQSDILNLQGEYWSAAGKQTNAIACHLKALELLEITGIKDLTSAACFMAGDAYLKKGEYDQAFSYFERALALAEETDSKVLQAKSCGGIALVYAKIKEHDKSNQSFVKAIDCARNSGDILVLAGLLNDAGKEQAAHGDKKTAESLLNEALEIGKKNHYLFLLPDIHHSLAELHSKAGSYEEAFRHLRSCIRVSDEVRSAELKAIEKAASAVNLPSATGTKAAPKPSEQFLLQVGHEVRTPLNGVLGMAGLLLGTHPTPEQLEYINTIRLSAGNLLEFVDEIFEYQRLFSSPALLRSNTIHVKELTDELFNRNTEKARPAGVRLSLKIDQRVPSTFTGDEELIRNLTDKLLSLAIRSSSGGAVAAMIDVPDHPAGAHHLRIQVTSSGLNLTADDQKWLQSDDGIKVAGSPGSNLVALAIVRKLASVAGGHIDIESLPGSGSRIYVIIPVKGIQDEGVITQYPGKAKGKESLLDVLLVEDNKVNQFLAQKLLTKMGFSVSLASNASEAVDALQRESFDAILMDVQMPVMTGYELTELIRTTLPPPVNQIPIIALTAYASPQEKEKALACGMNDFVTKPYSPEELKMVLLRVAEKVKQGGDAVGVEDISPDEILATVERLQVLFSGNRDDVVSLLNMLIVQIPQLLREAGKSIEKNDWSGSFQAFHKIRSSINLLKIRSLSNTIAELEEFSKDSIHADRIPQLYQKFSKACEKAVGYLKEEVIKLKRN